MNMFVVCTYDVDERRCSKVMKVFRRYLFHVQKSVFEGELNPNKLKELEMNICEIIREDDSVLIYSTCINQQMKKKQLGKMKQPSNIII